MYELWVYSFLACFIYNVFGDMEAIKTETADDFEESSSDGFRAHSDLQSKWRFVDRESFAIEQARFAREASSPSKVFYKIPIEKPTAILLSLRNLAESAFNITSITAYLHAAHRFSFYVQNNSARAVDYVLRPNTEVTLEYRFMPWSGLPAVDYVVSADVEYTVVVPQSADDDQEEVAGEPLVQHYRHEFMNVTVNVYESSSMKLIDLELLFMLITIVLFFALMAVVFYEFWWIPNQLAQGKQPLATQDFVVSLYESYAQRIYYVVMEKVFKQANPLKEGRGVDNKSSAQNGRNGASADSNDASANDGWLTGTSASSARKNSKNTKSAKKKKKRN